MGSPRRMLSPLRAPGSSLRSPGEPPRPGGLLSLRGREQRRRGLTRDPGPSDRALEPPPPAGPAPGASGSVPPPHTGMSCPGTLSLSGAQAAVRPPACLPARPAGRTRSPEKGTAQRGAGGDPAPLRPSPGGLPLPVPGSRSRGGLPPACPSSCETEGSQLQGQLPMGPPRPPAPPPRPVGCRPQAAGGEDGVLAPARPLPAPRPRSALTCSGGASESRSRDAAPIPGQGAPRPCMSHLGSPSHGAASCAASDLLWLPVPTPGPARPPGPSPRGRPEPGACWDLSRREEQGAVPPGTVPPGPPGPPARQGEGTACTPLPPEFPREGSSTHRGQPGPPC